MIITTSSFGKGAREEAARPDATPVGLLDGMQLVGLLIEHRIGVRPMDETPLELSDVGFELGPVPGQPETP